MVSDSARASEFAPRATPFTDSLKSRERLRAVNRSGAVAWMRLTDEGVTGTRTTAQEKPAALPMRTSASHAERRGAGEVCRRTLAGWAFRPSACCAAGGSETAHSPSDRWQLRLLPGRALLPRLRSPSRLGLRGLRAADCCLREDGPPVGRLPSGAAVARGACRGGTCGADDTPRAGARRGALG